jgi:DNA-binding NarL/FixJ family response regulator
MLRDQIEESLPVAEEALAIARAVGARQAEGHALNTLGVDLGELGERERGIEHLRAALQLALELDAPDDIGSAYVNLGDQIDQAGRIEEAAELGIEGIAACELAGVGRLAGAFVASEVALRLIRLGRYERAERLVAEALELNPTGIAEAGLRQARAQLLVERGDPGAAQPELELIREIIERANDPQWIGPFAAAEVELALWRGDPDEAARIAERTLSMLGETVVMVSMTTPLHAHALRAEADRREQARARSEPEQPGRAAELRDRLEGLLDSSPGPEVEAWVALGRAETERADGAAAASAFGKAADLFAELEIPFRTAYARLREVEAALAEGARGRDVADRLGEARALASDIGAPLLLAEIEGLARRGRVPLAAGDEAGAPVAATAPSPNDQLGLTPRELEVLALVAEGHTNREIGEHLYMSDKTASVHVSRILVKLSARNRGEAAATAHRLGLTQA